MLPSNVKNLLSKSEDLVIVATFQALNDIRRNHEDYYDQIKARVSTVVVDECHYEPAVEWGKSVKGLDANTVLLTATPYRNDLKLFRIDPDTSAGHFFHRDAVKQGIIRKLKVQEWGEQQYNLASKVNMTSLAEKFALEWNSLKKKGELPVDDPRAIICCGGAPDIEKVVATLRKSNINAIGIHEKFKKSKDDTLLKTVPNPKEQNAEVWVHQYKLTEGLDENRFCAVAVFTKIRSDRRLVQQIGRVLRKSTEEKDRHALLFAPKNYDIENRWQCYLDFETELDLLKPTHFRNVVDNILKTQPEVEYFDGRFRRKFQHTTNPHQYDVIIPPSVRVFQLTSSFELSQYIEDCTDTLNTEDAVILGPNLNGPIKHSDSAAFWIYASVKNSPYLNSTSLYEVRLESHFIVIHEGLALIADSRGIKPREYIRRHTLGTPTSILYKFMDSDFRPTNVSIDSSIPYDSVVRGMETRGHNLLNIPTSLTDRLQICRSAKGTSKDKGRRYLGITRGRLTANVSRNELLSFDMDRFEEWSKETINLLNSNIERSSLFDRYMALIDPPLEVEPQTFAVDFLREDLHFIDTQGNAYQVVVQSADVTDTSDTRNKDVEESSKPILRLLALEFVRSGKQESEPVIFELTYLRERKRFNFKKESGPSIIVSQEGDDSGKDKTLSEFLNQRQDLLLIGLEGGHSVYQGGNFYAIDYQYAEKSLLGLITEQTTSQWIKSEKGTKQQLARLKNSNSTKFPKQSLFYAIAQDFTGLPFQPDVLICDDMGSECADFIAISFQESALAFIHAKTGSGAKVSASSFHDVVAQAMKNFVYFTRSNDVPAGIESWSSKSFWNKTSIPRLQAFNGVKCEKEELWERVRNEILGTTDPSLYVVLATAGCCHKRSLQEAAKNEEKRSAPIAQLIHLLDGLSGHAKQLGVKVQILDFPFEKK